jgi:hypothetical protein
MIRIQSSELGKAGEDKQSWLYSALQVYTVRVYTKLKPC